MRFYADLHVRPPRPALDRHLVDLDRWVHAAAQQGISVLGSGAALDASWRAHAETLLEPAETGLWQLRADARARVQSTLPWPEALPRFILSDQVTLIYRAHGRKRKTEFVCWFSDFASAAAMERCLGSQPDLAPAALYEHAQTLASFVVPARIFDRDRTLLGWKHGFAPTDQRLSELLPYVKAIDRGAAASSRDCARMSFLDGMTELTMSHAESFADVGRNATLFDTDCDFRGLETAIITRAGVVETVGAVPEQSENALDGHRRCKIALTPEDSRKHRGICPACNRPLTLGVRHRIEMLADRDAPDAAPLPFRAIVPLQRILDEVFASSPHGIANRKDKLLQKLGPELFVLLGAPMATIETEAGAHVAEGVRRMREGLFTVSPGFDGKPGTVSLFAPAELEQRRHPRLFESDVSRAPCPHLQSLDRQQKQSVLDHQNHVLVLSEPGTGKTRTLARKIAHAIACEGVPPERCLTILASPRARKDLERRLTRLLPASVGTLPIYTMAEFAQTLATDISDDPIRAALIAIEQNQDKGDDVASRYRLVAIDDWQTFGPLEHALLRHVVGAEVRLWAAGDPGQSLGQAPADWDGRRALMQDFSPLEVLSFGTQYRSTQPIHTTFVQLPNGAAEADHIASAIARQNDVGTAFGDIAILFRAPAQGSLLRKALSRKNIPYQCRSHLQMLDNPLILQIFKEARSLPEELELSQRLEVAAAAVSGRENTLEVRDALELLQSLLPDGPSELGELVQCAAHTTELEKWDPEANRVSLLTLHAAQGLEFDVVFVAGCDEGILPHADGDLDSERRLFHVAMTRAHSAVRLTSARRRLWRGHIRDFTVSTFVKDLRSQALEDKKAQPPAESSPEQLALF